MSVRTSAGTKLYVSENLPAGQNLAAYEAVAGFLEVGEITDLGEYGAEYSLVTHTSLGQRRVGKFKGSFNNGYLQLQLGRDMANTGQAKLFQALHDDDSYTFKVQLQDGTLNFFTGKVMSFKTAVGSVDQITGATCTVEIDSDVFEKAPT